MSGIHILQCDINEYQSKVSDGIVKGGSPILRALRTAASTVSGDTWTCGEIIADAAVRC